MLSIHNGILKSGQLFVENKVFMQWDEMGFSLIMLFLDASSHPF